MDNREWIGNMRTLVWIKLVNTDKEPAVISNQHYFYCCWIIGLYLSDFIRVEFLVTPPIYFLLPHSVSIYRDFHIRIRDDASFSPRVNGREIENLIIWAELLVEAINFNKTHNRMCYKRPT
jgi:hypothetical protein